MVIGMATTKITITLDEDQLTRVRALVEAGKTPNISAFVKHAVDIALDDVSGWAAMLAEALRSTGGPLTRRERQWTDEVLGGKARHKRLRRAA